MRRGCQIQKGCWFLLATTWTMSQRCTTPPSISAVSWDVGFCPNFPNVSKCLFSTVFNQILQVELVGRCKGLPPMERMVEGRTRAVTGCRRSLPRQKHHFYSQIYFSSRKPCHQKSWEGTSSFAGGGQGWPGFFSFGFFCMQQESN